VLTIHTSLPLSSELGDEYQDVLNGEKLALKKSGAKIDDFMVNLVSEDDVSRDTGSWDPGVIAENVRQAATSRTAVAYIGGGDPGSSTVSVPILDAAGTLSVSPTDSYAGLTVKGIEQGEPDKYYPSGGRSFIRTVPSSDLEAEAIASQLKQRKIKKIVLISDTKVFGKSLSIRVERSAKRLGIEVLKQENVNFNRSSNESIGELTSELEKDSPDAVVFAASPNGGMEPSGRAAFFKLWQQLLESGPLSKALLVGPSTLAHKAFASELSGQGSKDRVVLVSPVTPVEEYGNEGKKFVSEFKQEFGHQPSPLAAYGYDAMNTVLSALKAAGSRANSRQGVIDIALRLKNIDSPIGKFSVTATGDTSRDQFYLYTVQDDSLEFEGKAP